MESLTYQNSLATKRNERNYLNDRTADVFFLFEVERKKVPSHKHILSSCSKEFETMFHDSPNQKGVVKIVDFTPDAFKEFLQFFYLTTVKLTSANALEMMSLGRKFAVKNCLDACTEFCKSTLTMDSICWGYELAILFELNDLTKFCEQKIGENPEKVFHSIGFLLCESSLLHQILQLNALNCDETVVFDGCIAWAQANCIQNELDENNVENIRRQLGDLVYEIRYSAMDIVDFYDRYCMYEGLFSVGEFEDIINTIALKRCDSGKFNKTPRNITNDEKKDLSSCKRRVIDSFKTV